MLKAKGIIFLRPSPPASTPVALRLHPSVQEEREAVMLGKDELAKIREEHEAFETWRRVSCHVIADLLEACAICGTVREKEHLVKCQWCEDVYFCKEGVCSQQHKADVHPAVAFWTW